MYKHLSSLNISEFNDWSGRPDKSIFIEPWPSARLMTKVLYQTSQPWLHHDYQRELWLKCFTRQVSLLESWLSKIDDESGLPNESNFNYPWTSERWMTKVQYQIMQPWLHHGSQIDELLTRQVNLDWSMNGADPDRYIWKNHGYESD